MQITLTLDLTAENLDKLKVFCQETGAAPAAKTTEKKATVKTTTKPETTTKTEATEEAPQATERKAAPGDNKDIEQKAVTLTDVRAVALKLSKAGKSGVLKEIFAKFGATKLSEVPEENYAELMEELANA